MHNPEPWGPHGPRVDVPTTLPNPTAPGPSGAFAPMDFGPTPLDPSVTVYAGPPVSRRKSLGLGVILVVLLGPVGLFYATIIGGLIMLIVAPFALAIGIGLLGGPVVPPYENPLVLALGWIGSLAWCLYAIPRYNRRRGL